MDLQEWLQKARLHLVPPTGANLAPDRGDYTLTAWNALG